MPDDALFDAADSGALATDEGLAAEVDRMLQDPRAQDAIASFHLQWLGVDEIEDMEKAAELYPAFDAELAEAMKQETARFASFAVLEDDGKLDTLLTAPYTLTEDPALLELYGATLPLEYQPGDPIPLDPTQRAGVLTQAGVLAHHAHPDQSSPILRGVLVRQNFFCQMLPPPPPDVDNVPPSPDPDATTREQFSQHTADPACAGCHQLIDPLGFGLENYDATGAFRRLEGDNPVDASGELLGTDVDGAFDGGVALSHVMAQSDQVRECVSRQWFRFAFGRSEAMEDSCTLDRLNQAFAASDFEIKALLRELVVSDAFRFRRSAPVTDAAPAQEDER
jgi:hypothetical protein